MKLDIVKIQNFFKRYKGYMISVVLLIVILFDCSGKSDTINVLNEKIAIRDKQSETIIKDNKALKQANKEKDNLISKNKDSLAKNKKEIASLHKQIDKVKSNAKKQIDKLKDNTLNDWKKYYQDVAKAGDKDIFIQGNALSMTKPPLSAIATKIINGEAAQAEVPLQKKEISKLNHSLSLATKNYNLEVEKNKNLETTIANDKVLLDNANANTQDAKDALEEERKRKRPKLIPILGAAALGYLTNEIISK
jgi:septal ring factor EnvC (AmiA/AmiB activator)